MEVRTESLLCLLVGSLRNKIKVRKENTKQGRRDGSCQGQRFALLEDGRDMDMVILEANIRTVFL